MGFFTAVLGLYSLTLSENMTVAIDASAYLLNVVNGEPDFHAHHLLYEPFMALIYEVVTSIVGPLDAVTSKKVVA